MAKTIGTILSLTDKISPKLITIGKNFDKLDKKQQAAVKTAAYQINNFAASLGRVAASAVKLTAATAVTLGAAAAKVGLSEALGLETYRAQLETATKDTQRAAEVMRYAINLANSTPFEGADMVSAAATLEMAGMKTEKYLTLLGDVAAGANRSIKDVQGAFTKAFNLGDYSALREATGLLLNADTVAKYGQERGITDASTALYAMLEDKFGGGMKKLAQTTKGAWSTITGATKNALANLIGATNEGTIRAGSVLEKLKEKATGLAEKLTVWQTDGTIDALSEKAAGGFDRVWAKAEGLLKFLGKYKEVILGIGTATLAVGALSKGIAALNTVLTATKMLAGVVSGALTLSPAGVIAGVAALAGAVAVIGSEAAGQTDQKASVMVGNDTVYAEDMFSKASDAWDKVKTSDDLLSGAGHLLDAAGNGAAGVAIEAGNFLERIRTWSENMFRNTMDTLYEEVNDYLSHLWKTASYGLKTSDSLNHLFGDDNDKDNDHNNDTNVPPAYALGTHYHPGGAARIGEHGGEIVDLPRGTRVYPAGQSTQMMQRGKHTIYLNFHISGAANPHQIAEQVAERFLEVLDNL